MVASRLACWAARRVYEGPSPRTSRRCRPRGGAGVLTPRTPTPSAPEPSGPIPEAGVVGSRIGADASEGAAADAGSQGSAITAQTGPIDAAFGWSRHPIGRG